MSVLLPNATMQDWILRKQYEDNPDCLTMDIHGNPAQLWQQVLCREYCDLVESRTWLPEIFCEKNKMGLWNPFEERMMVPALYEEIIDLPELSARGGNDCLEIIVRKGEKWGVVLSDGLNSILLPFVYDRITYFDFGYYQIELGGKLGLWSQFDGLRLACIADRIWYDEETVEIMYIADGIVEGL